MRTNIKELELNKLQNDIIQLKNEMHGCNNKFNKIIYNLNKK